PERGVHRQPPAHHGGGGRREEGAREDAVDARRRHGRDVLRRGPGRGQGSPPAPPSGPVDAGALRARRGGLLHRPAPRPSHPVRLALTRGKETLSGLAPFRPSIALTLRLLRVRIRRGTSTLRGIRTMLRRRRTRTTATTRLSRRGGVPACAR